MEIYDSTKPIIENLYLLSAPFIAIITLIGLYNLFLLKKSIINTSKFEQANHSIKQTDLLCNVIIPLYNEYFDWCEKEGIKKWDINISFENTNRETFIKDNNEETLLNEIEKRKKYENVYIDILNKIELVALIFYKEFASEKQGFEIIGKVFCEVVEKLSFEITISRKNKIDMNLEHTLRLFKLWKPKYDKEIVLLEKEFNIKHQINNSKCRSI